MVQKPDEPIRGCASCGRAKRTIVERSIDSLEIFLLSETQKQDYDLMPKHDQDAVTVYKHNDGRLYALHSRFVSKEGIATLCDSCKESISRSTLPRYSVANGYDFGNVIGLGALTVAEETLIARNIQYVHVLKLVGGQRALTGHLIAMEHDGRNVVARSLPRISLDGLFKVVIIGSKAKYNKLLESGAEVERLLSRYKSVLTVDGAKVRKWLEFLKRMNLLYSDVQLVEMSDEQWKQLDRIGEQLLRDAEVNESEVAEHIEKFTTSNVALPNQPQQRGEPDDVGIAHGVFVCQNPQNLPATDVDILEAVQRAVLPEADDDTAQQPPQA